MGCVIELQSTVDIVIGKTLNVAYFLNFYLTQTCTFFRRPFEKEAELPLRFLHMSVRSVCCNKRMEGR